MKGKNIIIRVLDNIERCRNKGLRWEYRSIDHWSLVNSVAPNECEEFCSGKNLWNKISPTWRLFEMIKYSSHLTPHTSHRVCISYALKMVHGLKSGLHGPDIYLYCGRRESEN